jgi:hypothetical protein
MAFIVKSPDGLHFWGPFNTANDAADWAMKQGEAIPNGWVICFIRTPVK